MTANFPVGEHRVRANGVELFVRVTGRGPPLVLQPPGWGIGSSPYGPLVERLARDFTVMTYDPRGSGRSGAPERDEDLNVAAFVADLEALRRHFGLERFALTGHSHGGLIALNYAIQHPDRVSALVPLAAQIIGMDYRNARMHSPVPELLRDAGFAKAWQAFQARGGFHALGHLASDAEWGQLLALMAPLYFRDSRHGPGLAAAIPAQGLPLRTLYAVSRTDDAYPVLEGAARISCPTLVVSGRLDLFCPLEGARELARRLPRGQLAEFSDSAHFPWIEEPEAFFARVVPFLKGAVVPAPQA